MASIVSACAAIILIAHCVGHGPVYLDLLRDCPFLLCFFLNILFCVSFSMPSKRTRLWIAILCSLVKLFVCAGVVDPGNRILTPGSHLCICHIVGTMMFFVGWGYKHGRQSVPQTCVVL